MTTLSETTPEQLAQLWLDTLPRVMRLVVVAGVHEANGHQLSVPQFRILKQLSHGSRLGSELAQTLQVTPPTISAGVDSLVRRGLVERGEASDRRARPLRITPAGAHCLQTAQQRALGILTQLLERMSGPERRALAQGLDALARALESYSGS